MQALCCCLSHRKRNGRRKENAAPSTTLSSGPDWNPGRPSAASASVQQSPCEGPIELCQLVEDNDSEIEDVASPATLLPRHAGLVPRDASHLEINDRGSSKSTRYLSSLIQLGVGPRDTIEFTLDDGFGLPEVSSQLQTSSSGNLQQRHASITEQPEDAEVSSVVSAGAASRPSTAPTASPQRLTGCSFTSNQLDRTLGMDNDFNIRRGSHAWEDQSALGVWLIAQSMRSRDCSFLPADDADSDHRERFGSPCHDFGGIDSIIDIPDPNLKTSLRELSHLIDSAEDPDISHNRRKQAVSSNYDLDDSGLDIASSSAVPAPGSTVPKPSNNNGSSHYNSILPSFQPSLADSASNKYSLSPEDLKNLELAPLEWPAKFSTLRNFGLSEGHSSYATAEEDETSTASFKDTALVSQAPQARLGPDSKSVTHSEPNSFHQREAELRSVEQRFGQLSSRKQADAPLRSRFREEFSQSAVRRPSKTSFMRRIQYSLSRLSRVESDAPSGSLELRHLSTSVSPDPGSMSQREFDYDVSQAAAAEASAAASVISRPRVARHWRNDIRRTSLGGLMTVGRDSFHRRPLSPETYANYRGRDEMMAGQADGNIPQASPSTTSMQGPKQRRSFSESAAPTSAGGHESNLPPTRLEKAVRAGLDRLLPTRKVMIQDRLRLDGPIFESRIQDSLSSDGTGEADERKRDQEKVGKLEPLALVTSSDQRGTLTVASQITGQSTVKAGPSNRLCLSISQTSEEMPSAEHSAKSASSVGLLESGSGANDGHSVGSQPGKVCSGIGFRRWKSTHEHGMGRGGSPSRTHHSADRA
ncbi:hypothetical protein L249_6107 [Ophiocordyceps polyrhachis-furcata BCC 54312]|uniref:Uncharacterized protein n=1 Tax=Ophiocordyceps polyrhachis-furcata BCC 54312 TaxID=1330021 RepID=A0A367LJ66_9HYPO|nr:hypothetical protein L249_6107 [Ophiocordyceps polyrhachis-furcata BCC 54312]